MSHARTPRVTIQLVTYEMTYYGPIILLLVGSIGCLCNFLIFTSRQFRRNSCIFYFLCSSIFDFLSITFGLLSRFAIDHLNSDLQNTNRIYCKTRAYFVSAIPLTATYFVLLSAIDRCMSSSTHSRLRSFSQMKVAYRSMLVVIILSFVSCSHILVSYDLRPKCMTLPGRYALFDGLFVVLWLGLLPHASMLVFCCFTIQNIRRTRLRRTSTPQFQLSSFHPKQQQRSNHRKTDAQLILMMLAQVGLSSLFILTRMVYYACYILGPSWTGKNKMVGAFLMSFTTLLYYANYAKSFYVYTLTSQVFRSVFVQRVKQCLRRMF